MRDVVKLSRSTLRIVQNRRTVTNAVQTHAKITGKSELMLAHLYSKDVLEYSNDTQAYSRFCYIEISVNNLRNIILVAPRVVPRG